MEVKSKTINSRSTDKRGIEDNSKVILFLNKNICCDLSVESFRQDGSNF